MFFIFIGFILLAISSALFLYRHQGKRQVWNIDLVNFFYLFILFPLIFFWAKFFLFYLLRQEVGRTLTLNQFFFIDSAFTLGGIFLFIPLSIHALTKSFALKKTTHEEFDIFHVSEYFHLWWSHIGAFVGAMLLITFIATLNVFFPLLTKTQLPFSLLSAISIVIGLVGFISIGLADPQQEKKNFMYLMKMTVGVLCLYHFSLFFTFRPTLSMFHAGFWSSFIIFLTAVICFLLFGSSPRFSRVKKRLVHSGLGENIQLFQ